MNDKENKRIQEITSQYGQGSVDSIIKKMKKEKKEEKEEHKFIKQHFHSACKDQGNVDKLVAELKENKENKENER